MPSWGELLGAGSVAEQLLIWQVGAQLVSELLGPSLELVRQRINVLQPVNPLSPADAASAVVRNFMDAGAAAAEAKLNGINGERFATLVHLSGEAPAPFQLAEALRRQVIPEGGTGPDSVSFDQGIAEGRLGDKWAPIIKALAVEWPTPTDALQALLEGQLEPADARTLYQRFGGDPAYFDLLYNTRGNAPTPMEALEMLRRGIIPETGTGPASVSYEQAFLEGPWRNKWLAPFKALGRYIPPPRTVTALLRTGSLTEAQAAAYFTDAGMDATLAAAYVHNAKGEKLAGTRQLAEAAVITLYETQALTPAEATAHLEGLGYAADDAALVLELADLQREVRALNSVITRVGTLYVGRKITRQAAADALGHLDVTAAHVAHLLATWDVERAANVKQLTAAQIESAWFYGVLDEAEALSLLEELGYSAYDAWVALSVRGKAPQAGKPARTVTGPGQLP